MQKRKKEKDWKRIGYEIFAFALFIFLIFIILINWQRNEDIKKEQEMNATTAVVYGKTANKHLFNGISYIVLLKPGQLDKATQRISKGYSVSVTKEKFDALEIGDTLDGYSIQGVFNTQGNLKYEYKTFYIVLCIIAIYPVGYISYLLLKIKRVDRFIDRHDYGIGAILYLVIFGVIFVVLIFGYKDLSADFKNGYEKFYAKDYVETIATVTDQYYYFSRGGRRGIQERDYYYLALSYKNEDGVPFRMTKAVKRNTYKKAEIGELSIKYKKDNPYIAYPQSFTLRDAFNLLWTSKIVIHILMVIFTLLLGYALFLMNRKRRTGSYWRTIPKSP